MTTHSIRLNEKKTTPRACEKGTNAESDFARLTTSKRATFSKLIEWKRSLELCKSDLRKKNLVMGKESGESFSLHVASQIGRCGPSLSRNQNHYEFTSCFKGGRSGPGGGRLGHPETEIKDPRVKNVTVTYVEMSGDLRQAKVYVSIMGDEATQNLSLRGLQSSADFSSRNCPIGSIPGTPLGSNSFWIRELKSRSPFRKFSVGNSTSPKQPPKGRKQLLPSPKKKPVQRKKTRRKMTRHRNFLRASEK